MDWKNVDTTHCGVAACAELMGDYWSIVILRDILAGISKFGDLQNHTGASTAVLSKRLQSLTQASLLSQLEYQDPGQRKRAEYKLTKKGRRLAPAILAMGQFGYDELTAARPPLVDYLDTNTGQKVRLGFINEDGQQVLPEDISMRINPNAYTPGFRAPQSRERHRKAYDE